MGETLQPGGEYAEWKVPEEKEFEPSKEAEIKKPGKTTAEAPQEAEVDTTNKENVEISERNEREKSEIDFEQYERSLNDGTADEYLENAGALPAEALLEEQNDERVWPELSEVERDRIRELLRSYAESKSLSIEEDGDSCMVV